MPNISSTGGSATTRTRQPRRPPGGAWRRGGRVLRRPRRARPENALLHGSGDDVPGGSAQFGVPVVDQANLGQFPVSRYSVLRSYSAARRHISAAAAAGPARADGASVVWHSLNSSHNARTASAWPSGRQQSQLAKLPHTGSGVHGILDAPGHRKSRRQGRPVDRHNAITREADARRSDRKPGRSG